MLLISFGILVMISIFVFLWVYILSDEWQYRKARKAIVPWLLRYKSRCNGSNRFLVSVPLLQDSFREFDTHVIERVFDSLIMEGIVTLDPHDNEWCVR